MNPIRIVKATHLRLPTLVLVGALLSLSSGCVYRPNIQQGNLLKAEDVDQVTVGMTRSQVRYLLGTPMISDPFQPDRWDYIYTLQRGRHQKVDRAYYVVFFADDKVARIEKLDRAEPLPSEHGRPAPAEAAKPVEAPAAAPAPAAPQQSPPAQTSPPPSGG